MPRGDAEGAEGILKLLGNKFSTIIMRTIAGCRIEAEPSLVGLGSPSLIDNTDNLQKSQKGINTGKGL